MRTTKSTEAQLHVVVISGIVYSSMAGIREMFQLQK